MSWKDDLLELKRQERWMDIIVFCEQQIQKDNNSADSYIQTIYLTHDILLEENPTPLEAQEAQRLLILTFLDGQQRHMDNAEYLFFVGSLIPVAEWLFGLKETNKEPKEQLGCKMLYQATLIEPYNMLYKWSYMDYYGDPQSAGSEYIIGSGCRILSPSSGLRGRVYARYSWCCQHLGG